jgi:LacI family transcriptional regulator
MAKQEKTVPALIDVARRAGVGAATVSRVINGGTNVSAKTLARVHAVIQELGYHPSHAARSLKGARTKTIGLIIPSVADPFFSSAAAAIQEVASRHGCLLLLAASENDPRVEHEQVVTLIQRRVDGLILVPSDGAEGELLESVGFPIICFDRPVKGSPVATVLGDNYGGAKAATEHLVERGYKRILCVGGYGKLFTSQKRFQGHKDVIRKAGLPYLAELSVEDYASTEAAVLRHVRGPDRVDAIFSTKNTTTVFIYKILRELNLRIPGQVALVGYDDFELADALEPPISVIRQPVAQIATRAAELLFRQMEEGAESKRMVQLKVELVLRGSC